MADYIDILDGTGAHVQVKAESLGGSLYIQALKLYKGPLASPAVIDNPTPMPVMPGLQITSDFSEATFSTSASGDTAVVASVGGKIVYVWAFEIQNQGSPDNTVKWRSNTTALPPGIVLTKNGSWTKDPMGRPWFKTASGEALNINLSGASGPVVGKVWYTQP